MYIIRVVERPLTSYGTKPNGSAGHLPQSKHIFIMATRSRIGIQLKDDSVLSVYHHWDGYPEWLGKQLMEHYNTRDKVTELIDGGDMSVCLTDDGEPSPQYYSLRGEDCPPRLDDSIFEFIKDKNNNEEYAYIWSLNNEWKCVKMNQFNDNDPEFVEIPVGSIGE